MTQRKVTYATSAVRLAIALRCMEQARTVDGVVLAKDVAKAAGLTPKDTEALRCAFEQHKARVRQKTS
ncbi:MAG: hypothetical protein ACT4NV_14845 [Rhodoferax sp.]